METWDAIRARRQVRSFRPEPIPDSDLQRITEAGWRAPSAGNRQHWEFVVVTDREQLQAMSTVWRGAALIAGAAATIGLVIPQYDEERGRLISYWDLGQATYAMMVAAADLGIGSGVTSIGDQEAARKILGVPDDHDAAFQLGLGYPADRPLRPILKPNRRPIEEVVRYGHW